MRKVETIIKAIEGTGGIKTTIAKRLGVHRNMIDYYLKKYATVKKAYERESRWQHRNGEMVCKNQNEANRLQHKAQALDNRITQIKSYLQAEMIRTEQDNIRAGIFRIRLQASPRSLIVRNLDAIPSEWKETITETKIDKAGILRHLRETGEIISGVDIKQNKHIRIY